MPISQNDLSVCFVIQNLQKYQIKIVNQLKICFIFVCFVIQHLKGKLRRQIDIIHKLKMIFVFILNISDLEKNSIEETHSNENISFQCLFCNLTYTEKAIGEHPK